MNSSVVIFRCGTSHMFRVLQIKNNMFFFSYFIKVMSKFQMHELSWNSKGKSLFPFEHISQQIIWLPRNHFSWRNSWFFIRSGMKYAIRVEKDKSEIWRWNAVVGWDSVSHRGANPAVVTRLPAMCNVLCVLEPTFSWDHGGIFMVV